MVDIILTEADPTYSAGYGGGPQAAMLTEENSDYFAEGGGGPQAVTLEETSPDYIAQGGGGLAEIELTELPPLYPAPQVTTGPGAVKTGSSVTTVRSLSCPARTPRFGEEGNAGDSRGRRREGGRQGEGSGCCVHGLAGLAPKRFRFVGAGDQQG